MENMVVCIGCVVNVPCSRLINYGLLYSILSGRIQTRFLPRFSSADSIFVFYSLHYLQQRYQRLEYACGDLGLGLFRILFFFFLITEIPTLSSLLLMLVWYMMELYMNIELIIFCMPQLICLSLYSNSVFIDHDQTFLYMFAIWTKKTKLLFATTCTVTITHNSEFWSQSWVTS